MVCEGIRLLLETSPEVDVVGQETSGRGALRSINDLRPDVAILELRLPELSGMGVIEQLGSTAKTRCLILTAHHSRGLVQAAIRAGAAGYVLKSEPPSMLFEAVEAVRRGEFYFSSAVAVHVVDAARDPDRQGACTMGALTSREREVLKLVAEGYSTKEIAQMMCISFRTVDTHRARLMEKLSIRKTARLVRFAIREGLVDL